MARILLIRHAVTDLLGKVLCGRTPGVSLNDQGRKQAEQLSRDLRASCHLDMVLASPLERTTETAEAIANPSELQVIAEPAFVEIDFGSWTGLSLEELEPLDHWKRYNQFRSLTAAPGGESLLDVQARASARLHELSESHPDAVIAIVTHADVIRGLLLHFLGMPLDHILRLEISPASVSEIILTQWEPRVGYVNRVCI